MLFSALRDIWEVFNEYTDQAIMFAIAAIIIYITITAVIYVVRLALGRRQHSIGYIFFKFCLFALFGVYCSYLISLTLSGREYGSRVGLINLIPFRYYTGQRLFSLENVENIVLFIPMGIMIPCVWKYFRGCVRTGLIGFFSSLLIELIQLITSRGFFDINDILLNTLGALIGYLIFAACYYGFMGAKRRLINDVSLRLGIRPPLGKLYERFVLRHDLLLFVLQLVPVFIWANVIMKFSSDSGEESGGLSKKLLAKILSIFQSASEVQKQIVEETDTVLLYEKILRKMAHMFEYGVLAILVWALIYSIRWVHVILTYGCGLLAAFALGIVDESNQASMPGRTSSFIDVIIDSLGAAIALTIVAIIVAFLSSYYKRKLKS